MPQENLNKIWNAGKYFEPKQEENPKPTPEVTQPSTVKRKINVAKAFIPTQEDPFKKKVEAVLKGVEPAPVRQPEDYGEAKEKQIPDDSWYVGRGQNDIGGNLVSGKRIHVKGNAGIWTGRFMIGGEVYVEGNTGNRAGRLMSGGEIHIEGDAGDMTGDHMTDGKIHVKGNARKYTGYFMSGGILRVDGSVASFDTTAFTSDNKGTIIWKGETIWKDGQKVEPGWTNLNVKEKIEK